MNFRLHAITANGISRRLIQRFGGDRLQPYQVYVNYMLETYFCADSQQRLSPADLKNCAVCDRVLRSLSQDEQVLIKYVFSRVEGPVRQNVLNYAEQHGMAQKDVWRAVRVVSNKIAREKELI